MAPVAASALCRLPTGGEDPVFAVIERHREAVKAEYSALIKEGQLEEIIPDERCRWSPRFGTEEEPPENCTDDPVWIEAQIAHVKAAYERTDLLLELLTTPPTTIAGVAAILAHLAEPPFPDNKNETHLDFAGDCWRDDLNEAAALFMPMIPATLRKLLAA
jgi:hypothetical protein